MQPVEVSSSAANEISRPEQLSRLRQENFDLAVIGGGINGAAIARDAAMRGCAWRYSIVATSPARPRRDRRS